MSEPTEKDRERAREWLTEHLVSPTPEGMEALAAEFAAVREEAQGRRGPCLFAGCVDDAHANYPVCYTHRQKIHERDPEARIRELEAELALVIAPKEVGGGYEALLKQRAEKAEAEVERLQADLNHATDNRWGSWEVERAAVKGKLLKAEADLAALKERHEKLGLDYSHAIDGYEALLAAEPTKPTK